MADDRIRVEITVNWDDVRRALAELAAASIAANVATEQLATTMREVETVGPLMCPDCGEGPFRSTRARGAHRRHRHPKIAVTLCACGHPERVHDDDHEGDGRGACLHPSCYEGPAGCSAYRPETA